MGDNRVDRAIAEAEQAYERAERQQLTVEDRVFLNSLVDAQREQDRLADEDYADRMLERLDEERNDA